MDKRVSDYQQAVDGLSVALTYLSLIEKRNPKPTKDFVDAIARLNQQSNNLDKLLKSLKGLIKDDLLESSETIRQGNSFEAVLTVVSKMVLDTDKVKAFLGRKLHQFQTQRDDKVLSFRPKT